MSVIEVAVVKLQAGMKLASDVFWKSNVPYALKGTVLNDYLIKRLQSIPVATVFIYHEAESSYQDNLNNYHRETEKFAQTYDQALADVHQLFDEVKSGKEVHVEKIKKGATDIVAKVMTNNNILGRLRLVKTKDEYTYKHSVNVAMLATIIGKWMGLTQQELYHLGCAGLLHDIGKARTPDKILNKPGKLTENEYLEMKNHTVHGYQLLLTVPQLERGVALASLCHHERYDGSGYPLQLEGEKTHIYARIVAVADIYDAMTSDRVYRSKVSPFKVAEEIAASSYGCLDPHVAHTFLKNIYAFYVGNVVQLNNGVIGEIIYVNPQYPTRPVVRTEGQYIDLVSARHLDVVDVLQ